MIWRLCFVIKIPFAAHIFADSADTNQKTFQRDDEDERRMKGRNLDLLEGHEANWRPQILTSEGTWGRAQGLSQPLNVVDTASVG